MIIKYKMYILVMPFLMLISGQVSSQESSNSYKWVANSSAKIVQAHIIDKEEVRYDYDEENLVCGYILDLNVSKSFKGGENNFKLLATNSDILMDDDQEYFIFARKNPKFGATGADALDFVNCDGGKSTRMDVSRFEFLATRLRQQIFPLVSYDGGDRIVDEDTGVIKRGQWMMIVDRIANAALPYTIMRRRLNNGNENIIEEMSYTDFLAEIIDR